MLLVFEKLTGLHKCSRLKSLRFFYTILFVVLGWVIFRATDIGNAITYIGTMFGASGTVVDNSALFYLKENAICFIIAIIASTPVLKWMYHKYLNNRIGRIATTFVLLGVFLLSVIYIVKGTYNPFIYFNF